jgi:hypothetical protein
LLDEPGQGRNEGDLDEDTIMTAGNGLDSNIELPAGRLPPAAQVTLCRSPKAFAG